MGHMEEGILPREGMDGSDHIGFILAHCAEGIEISFLYTFSFLSLFGCSRPLVVACGI